MIYRSTHAEFIYEPNESDFIIVTFNGANIRADGKRFFGDTFFRKYKISALGIVSTKRNWFPREGMEDLCAAARSILRQYRHVTSYGGSMGGHGAIKYSRLLGADTVVAFSPQLTIDPKAAVPSAYSVHYEEEIHHDVTIRPSDLGGRIFLFYDPYHQADNASAQAVAEMGADVQLIAVPHVGHTVITPFAKPNRILEILQLCREEPEKAPAQLRRMSLEVRRRHYLRYLFLALGLAAKHPRWTLALCSRCPEILTDKFLSKSAPLLAKAGHIQEALAWARAGAQANPTDFARIHTLAAFLAASGDFPAARREMEAALALDPENVAGMMILSRMGQAAGELDLAFGWGRKAIDTKPADLLTFLNLAKILRESGFSERSLAVLHEALLLHPVHSNLLTEIELLERDLPTGPDEEG